MGFSPTAKNQMLDQWTTIWAAAFSGNPGTSGANEISGGSYARVQATFNAASGGVRQMASNVQLQIPAGATVAFTGYFTAETGGTFIGDYDAADETFNQAGTYTINAAATTLTISD
jgi:hypothetical protein